MFKTILVGFGNILKFLKPSSIEFGGGKGGFLETFNLIIGVPVILNHVPAGVVEGGVGGQLSCK